MHSPGGLLGRGSAATLLETQPWDWGKGPVPAEASLVRHSEWHWRSILLHMKSTEALYSSFGLSDMEMRL